MMSLVFKTTCLNCGKTIIGEAKEDELGMSIICPSCNSSSDVEDNAQVSYSECPVKCVGCERDCDNMAVGKCKANLTSYMNDKSTNALIRLKNGRLSDK